MIDRYNVQLRASGWHLETTWASTPSRYAEWCKFESAFTSLCNVLYVVGLNDIVIYVNNRIRKYTCSVSE